MMNKEEYILTDYLFAQQAVEELHREARAIHQHYRNQFQAVTDGAARALSQLHDVRTR